MLIEIVFIYEKQNIKHSYRFIDVDSWPWRYKLRNFKTATRPSWS